MLDPQSWITRNVGRAREIFIVKLTEEDKIKITELREKEIDYVTIAKSLKLRRYKLNLYGICTNYME